MSRYAVTGATGFLGRAVVNTLRERGHEVVAIARHVSEGLAGGGVRALEADVLDRAAMERAFAGCAGVFHCAGKVSRDPADAEAMYRVHVLGTRSVMEAARAAGVKRVVVASTSGTVAVSEDPKHVATEDDPTPTGIIQGFPYYRSKLYAEQEAFSHNRDGLEVVCVNPALLLGPGDVFASSTRDVKLFLDRAIPAVPSGGISYVDVRDAASAMASAMDRGRPGHRYLLTASNCTVRDFFARLERITGIKAPRLPMPRSRAVARLGTNFLGRVVKSMGGELPVDEHSVEMGQLYWYCDSSRAARELGFAPRDPVETLADTVRDLQGDALDRGRDEDRQGFLEVN